MIARLGFALFCCIGILSAAYEYISTGRISTSGWFWLYLALGYFIYLGYLLVKMKGRGAKPSHEDVKVQSGVSEVKKYRIESLNDFLAIPEDRIDECLLDFKEWIAVSSVIKKSGVSMVSYGFIFVDDGLRGIGDIHISKKIK